VANAGVGISIPIVSASRPKIQRKMAEVQMAATKNSLETVAVNVRKDLAIIHEDYINLQQKTEQTNILVQQAEKAFKLAQVRFKEGLITNVELLTLQAVLLEDAKLPAGSIAISNTVNKIESHKSNRNRIY
jgi:outer membrane protein TolC